MFNKAEIRELQREIQWLKDDRTSDRDKISNLELDILSLNSDLRLLANHLGVEYVEERQVVEVAVSSNKG